MKKLIQTLFIIIICIAGQVQAKSIQSIKSIQQATKQYIANNLPINTEYKIKQGRIDPRLKLPLCPQPLDVFINREKLKAGRNAIGIRCNESNKWTIYTTTIIYIYKNVVTLSQAVNRGEIIQPETLQIEKKEVSSLRSGFYIDPALVINKQATRKLAYGSVLSKSTITEPKLIKRGEKVTIKASSQNLVISMTGVALMDGKKGQNIRVKNIKSQQIVQATVINPGQVVVMF